MKTVATVLVGVTLGLVGASYIKAECKDWKVFQSCTFDTPFKSLTFTNFK